MSDVAARAEELRAQLNHHSHRYYVLDDPEIGDDAYDALLDELRATEEIVASGGPPEAAPQGPPAA